MLQIWWVLMDIDGYGWMSNLSNTMIAIYSQWHSMAPCFVQHHWRRVLAKPNRPHLCSGISISTRKVATSCSLRCFYLILHTLELIMACWNPRIPHFHPFPYMILPKTSSKLHFRGICHGFATRLRRQASGTGSLGFTAEQALGVASTHSKLQSTPSAPGHLWILVQEGGNPGKGGCI